MFAPSRASRADHAAPTTAPEPATEDVLVVSVRADEKGARSAGRWADRVAPTVTAEHTVSTDPALETRLRHARRVLVLDPGLLGALRGFGPRAGGRARLQLLSRLAYRHDDVTWVHTEGEAVRWLGRV